MNIGELSAATDVSAKMIRHYEEIGLLPPAKRSDSNYRVYEEADVHTLRFLRRARRLGFSMRQMRDLLSLWQNRRRSAGAVKALAAGHLRELEQRVKEMQEMIATLRALERSCAGGERPECPILDELGKV